APPVSSDKGTPKVIQVAAAEQEPPPAALVLPLTHVPLRGTLTRGNTVLQVGSKITGSPADVTYAPVPSYTGQDSFQFTVTETGDGAAPALTSAAANVDIFITPSAAPQLTGPTGTITNPRPTITWTI